MANPASHPEGGVDYPRTLTEFDAWFVSETVGRLMRNQRRPVAMAKGRRAESLRLAMWYDPAQLPHTTARA